MLASAVALPPEVAVLGVITGLGYGLAAAGLVLTFRQSRVLNLAHGQVGAFAAVLLASLVLRHGWAYWLALAVAIFAGGAIGAALELGVIRRLAAAPPLVAVVATLAAAQALLRLGLSVGGALRGGELFPQPPGVPSFRLGALLVTRADVSLLVLAPVVVVVLAAVSLRTRIGWAARAAAANPAGARMLGLRVGLLNALVWACGGALAALSAALVLPSSGVATAEALGPGLLLRVLTAAALARFDSVAVALGGGVVVGMIEQTVLWNGGDAGLMAPILFGVAVVAVLARRPVTGRLAEPASWLLVARRGRRWGGSVMGAGIGVALAAALAVPLLIRSSDAITLASVAGLGICAVSAWVVAALAGQLSLGQVAIAGFGAAVAASVGASSGSSVVGMLAALVAGATLAVAVALAALRDRGALLAVLTLALAQAGEGALLGAPWALGDGRSPARVVHGRGAAAFACVTLVLAVAGAWSLLQGGAGRRMAAARDNERSARAFGLAPAALRLQAVAVAGALAGLGGAVMAQALFVATPGTFPAVAGIDVVLAAVVGGLGSPGGAVVGTALVLGLPAFVHLSPGALALLYLAWLVLLVASPGGVIALFSRLTVRWSRRAHVPSRRHAHVARVRGHDAVATGSLRVEGLCVSYSGVRALEGVDLDIPAGSAVAIVGPNGAGKTTLIDALTGAAAPSAGRVELDGVDVSELSVEERVRLGIVRSDQDGTLFPTLTALDLALLPGGGQADGLALLAGVGLDRNADQTVSTLSTGMRRLAELACVLALRPRVLLLDEPSAGLAQPEIAPLAELLATARIRDRFSLVLVEHDLELARRLCDRAVLLVDGRVSADGPVGEVAGARS